MRQLLGRAVRLGAVLVCASTWGMLGPAVAVQAGTPNDTITVSFDDECGYYVKVTVANPSASPVDYQLGVEDVDATSFSIAAGATKVHLWPTAQGKDVTVTSGGLATAQSHEHKEPAECQAPDLDFDGALTCQSIVVIVANSGEVAAQVRITVNGSPVGELLDIPAAGSAQRLVAMTDGDVINLQRQTGGPDPQWVNVLDGVFQGDPACQRLPQVELTDTCTGVRLKTTNTFEGELVLEFGGLPPSGPAPTEHTVAAGATFEHDFTVAENVLVGARWQEQEVYAAATKHLRPKSCSDSGGGLPVTGTGIGLSAAAGVLLAVAGAAIFLLARRRRSIG